MNLKPRRNEEPEINVTSLIDVVLLLVVFFMLSSNFTAEGRMRVRLPQASTAPSARNNNEPLVVTVTAGGTYLVNGRELINASPDTLRSALLKVMAPDAAAAGTGAHIGTVTLRADGRATHQSVVTAMDVLGRLGVTQINIATIDEQGSAGAAH